MFWGITLEHGKTYSQIVEMPFHISMAALGFSNLTDGATTVMVESEKAEYALCTLQAGKIPQQPLDLNFTEGEEVKFFLEGNGGDVHLTGYLLETPREYEYEEDDVDALMSSDNDTSVTLEDEENEGNCLSSENEDELGVVDEEQITSGYRQGGRSKLAGSKRHGEQAKGDKDDDGDDNDDGSDSSDEDISLEAMLMGDLDDSDESASGDDDWKPKKDNGKKEKAVKSKKKSKASSSRTSHQPISQTLINLMHMKGIEDGSESDSEWEPGVLVSKSSKSKPNGLSGLSVDDVIDADDDAAEVDEDETL